MTDNPIAIKKKQLDSLLSTVTLFHSSLDIHTVLQHFSHNLKKHLEYDSLHYHHPTINNRFTIGTNEKHHSHYDLNIDKCTLGEITFTRKKPFKTKEIDALESQLCLLINPLKNAIVHHQALHAALHDPLTTLLNRGSLPNTLQRELQLATRHQKGLSVLMLDIDNFKDINDTHGHLIGDQILMETASIIQHTIRETDFAFRIGGEEFLLLLINTTSKGAKQLANRLRESIAKGNLANKNPSLPKITASLGVAHFLQSETQQSLLARADKAMYQAKARGKNKVVVV